METQPKQGVAYRYMGNERHMTTNKIYSFQSDKDGDVYSINDAGDKFWPIKSEFKDFQEVDWTKATDEERLTEAKRRYKPGMFIKCVHKTKKGLWKICENDQFIVDVDDKCVRSGYSGSGVICLYGKAIDKWAEIIEEPLKHECKHCGVETNQPDEECYKAPQEPKAGDLVEYSDSEDEDIYWEKEIVRFTGGKKSNGRFLIEKGNSLASVKHIRLPEVDKVKDDAEKLLAESDWFPKDTLYNEALEVTIKAIEWGRNNPKTK
jgi:hypothetical protein